MKKFYKNLFFLFLIFNNRKLLSGDYNENNNLQDNYQQGNPSQQNNQQQSNNQQYNPSNDNLTNNLIGHQNQQDTYLNSIDILNYQKIKIHKKAGWLRFKIYFLCIIPSIFSEISFQYGGMSAIFSLIIFNLYIYIKKIKIVNSYFVLISNIMFISVVFISSIDKTKFPLIFIILNILNLLNLVLLLIDLFVNWNIILEEEKMVNILDKSINISKPMDEKIFNDLIKNKKIILINN